MKQYYKQLPFLFISNFLFLILSAQVKKVDVIGITVSDMNRSIRFYSEVLGFKKISDEEFNGASYEQLEGIFGLNMRVVKMQLGEEVIELTDYLTSGGRTIPPDAKPNDLSFQHIAIVVSDMNKAYAQLRRFNVEHVSTSPQTLPATIVPAAGIKAFYFHDPDNHNLELIYFPKGKGLPKWQQAHGKIFLGFDHTAIGVSDTEKSLELYQSILGIERKGESFNYGNEQAHLNNVEGASLHITGFRSAAGPGIEFLQYLQPGSGKPYPSDTRADDLWYWQTTLLVTGIESLFDKLKGSGYSFVSEGLVELKNKKGIQKAFIIRDGDGHALLIKEMF
jgi:catechol 2,3-dioxygenase-like lactoylglutathione lyase family enzyme